MCRYNTKAKIPVNDEQTSKQQRTRMKTGHSMGRVKQGSKENEYD
jgi:hypothetical protein